MEQKRKDSRKKAIGQGMFNILFLLAGCALVFYFFLVPPLVKSYLLHSLRAMGLADPRLTIRHVGIRHLDIQALTLGDARNPDLVIPSLAVDFSLADLLKGKVGKIVVAGMKLRLTAGKEGVTVKGLEALFKSKKGGGTALPFRQVHVVSSLAVVSWQGQETVVPFDLRAVAGQAGETVTFSAALNPYGDALAAKGALRLPAGDGSVTLSAAHADIGRYLADFPVALFHRFRSAARWSADVQLRGWKIAANRASLSAPAFSLGFPGAAVNGALQLDCRLNRDFKPENIRLKLVLASVERADLRIEIPFVMDISGGRLDDMRFTLGGLRLRKPPGIAVQRLQGTAALQGGRVKIRGSFALGAGEAFFNWLLPGARLPGWLTVGGTFQVAAGGQDISWNVSGAGRGRLALAMPSVEAKAAGVALAFSGSGNGGGRKGNLDLEFRGVSGKYRDLDFAAESIRCRGAVSAAGASEAAIAGRLKIAGVDARQAGGIAAAGLSADMPWKFPPAMGDAADGKTVPRSALGNWRIASLRLGDLDLGKTTGEVWQKGLGIGFSGVTLMPLMPLQLTVAGDCRWRDDGVAAALGFAMAETHVAENSDLRGLHPALAGILGSGYLSASGNVSFHSGSADSQACFRVRDGNMASEASGIRCLGMDALVRFKDLLNLRSAFSQRLDFKQLHVSGLQLGPGKLIFEVDGTESLYLEEGEFAFGGGRALLQPARLDFHGGAMKVTLYCDRINFAEMLNSLLGDKIGSGDAELNGLLTANIVEGLPVFHDGYLYSTPGISGNIQFARSEAIAGGVLIVEEAVKDFNYDWIKVKLDTTGENLNMTAFINGTPAGKLPLTYDTRSKEIVRDPKGRRGLELKGLLLELRFNDIDLRRLMKGGARIYFQEKKMP